MENENKLTPENDVQELWELHGRVLAIVEYIKKAKYGLSGEVILAMLGMEADGDS